MKAHIRYSEEFAAIKGFPGYLWHLEEKHLYSIKIEGILKPLKEYTVDYYRARYVFNNRKIGDKYYELSKKNKRHVLFVDRIESKLIYEDTINK